MKLVFLALKFGRNHVFCQLRLYLPIFFDKWEHYKLEYYSGRITVGELQVGVLQVGVLQIGSITGCSVASN